MGRPASRTVLAGASAALAAHEEVEYDGENDLIAQRRVTLPGEVATEVIKTIFTVIFSSFYA